MADYHTSDCLWDRLIDWELSIWVNRDSFSSVIFPTVSTVNRMAPHPSTGNRKGTLPIPVDTEGDPSNLFHNLQIPEPLSISMPHREWAKCPCCGVSADGSYTAIDEVFGWRNMTPGGKKKPQAYCHACRSARCTAEEDFCRCD